MPNLSKRLITATSALLAILIIAAGVKTQAQAVSIASITGRVTDSSGAVVNGAQVKIRPCQPTRSTVQSLERTAFTAFLA